MIKLVCLYIAAIVISAWVLCNIIDRALPSEVQAMHISATTNADCTNGTWIYVPVYDEITGMDTKGYFKCVEDDGYYTPPVG